MTQVLMTQVLQHPGPRRWTARNLGWLLVGVVVILPSVLPLVWLVSTSFKTYIQTQTFPPALVPRGGGTSANFTGIFSNPLTLGYIKNSVIITAIVIILVMVLSLPAAYGLARFKLKSGRDLQFWIISLRILPPMAVVVPVFLILSQLHLTGSIVGVICMLTMVNSSFAVWLCTSFFEEIPEEIEEAAQLDGLGRWRTFFLIGLPLARTGLLTVLGFVFIFAWNELPFTLVLAGEGSQTLPVFLSTFSSITLINYGAMAAAIIIHIVPVLFVTGLLQRHLVEGLSFGAVK